jgi:hypothetical protein
MLTTNPKRIHLLGNGRHEEIEAGGVITPGMLLALNSSDKVVAHATATGWAERLFALEDALQGRAIDTNYAADDVVGVVVAEPGDVVYAWLQNGENVDIGDQLTSNGDGTLKEATSTNHRIAVALEAVDASDSDLDGNLRIKVRVI